MYFAGPVDLTNLFLLIALLGFVSAIVIVILAWYLFRRIFILKNLKLTKKSLLTGLIALVVIYAGVWLICFGVSKYRIDNFRPNPNCGTSYGGDVKLCGYRMGRNFLGLPQAQPQYEFFNPF